MPKFYVTTPIYYVNDKPHIGHAYTTILADVLARYHRLLGDDVHFLTGTDEHGQKVQQAAVRAGISGREQADRTVVRFQALWEKLEITHDDFIRTTEPRHKQVVQAILQDLYDRDEIYAAEYDGWYCVPCERFFMERDLSEDTCPECRRTVDRITERNYFFRMGKYRDWLVEYIQNHPEFIQPVSRCNETLGFLRQELNDLCISRPKSRLAWGIELPFDADYVTYVWFDALVNYISAPGYHADQPRFERWWPADVHLVGKDILTTHTVYWPTMLKAMGLPLPKTVFAHGWWLTGREKMSKTAGNVVNPLDLVERVGVDAFRYFLMAEMTLGQDASFTEDAFVRRYNADLANDLGNLLSRVTKLMVSAFDATVPSYAAGGADEAALRDCALAVAAALPHAVSAYKIDGLLGQVADLVREANRYLEKTQPWRLAKSGDLVALGTVLYTAAETLRIAGGILFPVMPGKMGALRATFGLQPTPVMTDLQRWGVLPIGAPVRPATALFPRLQLPQATALQTADDATGKPGASTPSGSGASGVDAPAARAPSATSVPEGVQTIEYADFAKIELRTAEIVAAERVVGADKLLRLQLRVGDTTRQIVAGIAQHYEPETLVGRVIVIVANLKPAVIRGVESNGMLLAASQGKHLRLLTADGDIGSNAIVK